MDKEDLDLLVWEIELRQEIEGYERQLGPYRPLTEEEIASIVPTELSAEERKKYLYENGREPSKGDPRGRCPEESEGSCEDEAPKKKE